MSSIEYPLSLSASRCVVVDIYITAERYQQWYAGYAKMVRAQARSGLSVLFPASCLRPFVSHEGVVGSFEIVFDQHNKLVSFHRVRT